MCYVKIVIIVCLIKRKQQTTALEVLSVASVAYTKIMLKTTLVGRSCSLSGLRIGTTRLNITARSFF